MTKSSRSKTKNCASTSVQLIPINGPNDAENAKPICALVKKNKAEAEKPLFLARV